MSTKPDGPEVLDDDVRDALERIAKDDQDGLIQPEAVVEAAKDPESPLHHYFEWDVEAAAQAYWLVQARHLIGRYTVVRVDNGPQYVNVTLRKGRPDERRGYVPMQRAAADPDLLEQIVHEAEVVIVAWRNRLSAFNRAREIVAALDVAVERMRTPKATTRKAAPRRSAA